MQTIKTLTNDLPEKVLAAQARLLHKQVPQSLIGGTGVAICFLVLAFNHLSVSTLVVGSAIYLIMMASRLYSYGKMKGFFDNDAQVARWAKSSPLVLFSSGLVWGGISSGIILVDDSVNFWFILTLLAGLSSGAVGAVGAIHRCYLAYSLAMLFPVVCALLLINQWLIAIMVTLFFFMNNSFSKNIYQANLNNIITKIENESLIKQLEEQQDSLKQKNIVIQSAMQEADKANRSKSVFLASASHDLAQPLHSLKLFLAALSQDMTTDSQRGLIDKATICASNMSELFISLLDISKLDAGIVSVNKQVHDVANILSPLAIEFETQARNKGLKFHSTLISCAVVADQTIIQRIVRNLLHNALKYTETGSISLTTALNEDRHITIEVIDTGTGINADELPNIFTEFYQIGNSERDRTRGLGLGLAIVKRMSDLSGLDITVQSEQDVGSIFSLKLQTSGNVQPQPEQPSLERTVAYADRAHNILFIDDEEHTRMAMSIMLKNMGHEVIAVESVGSAIEAIITNDFTPELIISDYRLRDKKTGVEAIIAIREEFNQDIPALIITGDTGAESLKDIRDLGVEVLHKLSSHPIITEKIESMLNNG